MMQPDKVAQNAKRKEKENQRFRSFLKRSADPEELDHQFMLLHKEIFQYYDCARCRNCCKLLHAEIPEEEVDKDAALLKMSREDFIAAYLERDNDGAWVSQHLPCDFLNVDGSCRLGDCRPDSCKKFPYTDQPERLFSLFSVIDEASVCLAAYEIQKKKKKEYGFPLPKRKNIREEYQQDEDTFIPFIAGYTSWGYPYGILEAEEEDIEADSDELPF